MIFIHEFVPNLVWWFCIFNIFRLFSMLLWPFVNGMDHPGPVPHAPWERDELVIMGVEKCGWVHHTDQTASWSGAGTWFAVWPDVYQFFRIDQIVCCVVPKSWPWTSMNNHISVNTTQDTQVRGQSTCRVFLSNYRFFSWRNGCAIKDVQYVQDGNAAPADSGCSCWANEWCSMDAIWYIRYILIFYIFIYIYILYIINIISDIIYIILFIFIK